MYQSDVPTILAAGPSSFLMYVRADTGLIGAVRAEAPCLFAMSLPGNGPAVKDDTHLASRKMMINGKVFMLLTQRFINKQAEYRQHAVQTYVDCSSDTQRPVWFTKLTRSDWKVAVTPKPLCNWPALSPAWCAKLQQASG